MDNWDPFRKSTATHDVGGRSFERVRLSAAPYVIDLRFTARLGSRALSKRAVVLATCAGHSTIPKTRHADSSPACPFCTATDSLPYRGICSPVDGLRIRVPSLLIWLKLNIWLMELAMPSKEPWPIRCPPSQLSSMKRMTEVWSVAVWSTKFSSAHGEITIKGCRGPYPQRPSACTLP